MRIRYYSLLALLVVLFTHPNLAHSKAKFFFGSGVYVANLEEAYAISEFHGTGLYANIEAKYNSFSVSSNFKRIRYRPNVVESGTTTTGHNEKSYIPIGKSFDLSIRYYYVSEFYFGIGGVYDRLKMSVENSFRHNSGSILTQGNSIVSRDNDIGFQIELGGKFELMPFLYFDISGKRTYSELEQWLLLFSLQLANF
jgi:hypothetical protein